ncbi:hypothetical protein EZS27_005490 [termite gut metagenome]|uniref:Beta-galactosidase trimerisation domain-containing protein n=1 Tax=termite gut metagenome TaxID=433724 RepID=A0A5J4SLL1_9ZZZZ
MEYDKMKIVSLLSICLVLTSCFNSKQVHPVKEKTVFQSNGEWKPVTDVRADVAIVYDSSDRPDMTFEQRVQTWRDRGYITHFMTGIAWGQYEDYFTGKWDGKPHLDEGQVNQNGDTVWHGGGRPYIVPSINFLKYMKEERIKKVIDAGIDAIYLEEPEFWAFSGYSEAFKREWQNYYGFTWRPQHESPENTYLSNKLKYYLYYRALEDVFTYAKEYGKSKGMDVRCYVPTHSLVNYSSWQIVSPEASLASLPCVDGYIAQVWTGTSREKTYFNSIMKERVFENAFLEYGSMESMTRPTGRKMFFLTDPIEDQPRDWSDYKKNYQATFTAQLLYPMIADYEVMPWPNRIYEGLYKTSIDSDVKEQIPRFYSTQMQVMINSLNFMPLSDNKVNGSQGIGVAMSNSLMFQRFPTHGDFKDPQLSNFYGQTLPLLKRGIPVNIVHLENVSYPETWKDVRLLILSYSNMKPMNPEAHRHIAEWVKKGGVLLYCGCDDDPYQTVLEWWNTGNNKYNAPSEHLFEIMGIDRKAKEREYSYGTGTVYVSRHNPKEFVMKKNIDKPEFVDIVARLYEEKTQGGKLVFKNNLHLERGPYDIIAVMDENENTQAFVHTGMLIDLFDPSLPVITRKEVKPGEQAYLFNINRVVIPEKPQVLASASRIYDELVNKNRYTFVAKSPLNTTNAMRVLLPAEPKEYKASNTQGKIVEVQYTWDSNSKTCFLGFENHPDGIQVELKW